MVAFPMEERQCSGKRFWTDGSQLGPCLRLAEQRVVGAGEAHPTPSVLLCVGCRQVPSGLLTIPRQPFGLAWVTCMSSASQQPCGGVSQGRDCLCPRCLAMPKEAGLQRGAANQSFFLRPNSRTPGVFCEAQTGMNGAELGTLVRPGLIAAALLSCH